MDSNLINPQFFSPFFYSPLPYLPYTHLQIADCTLHSPCLSVSTPEPKRYQRTWTKLEMAKALNATVDYSQTAQKPIDALDISDFAVISLALKQSPEQIMKKIKEIQANGTLRPGIWSKDEDTLLTSLVHKGHSWGHIAQVLNNELHKLNIRTSKSCRERWNNYLNPNINKGPWSQEEDCVALKGFLEIGSKWKSISRLLPNRIEGAVKNRVKSLMNKIRQRCNSEEEVMKRVKELCENTEYSDE